MSSPPPTPAVVREWSRRIEAEYRSSAITSQLCLWLIQLGFPRELIDDGMRIVGDELDHAELSAKVCVAANAPTQPRMTPESLALGRHPEGLVMDALSACVRFFCLGETVAVPLFVELRSQCTEPTAKATLDRVLKDEVRHRQFGWDVLEYFVDHVPGVRERVEKLLPDFLDQLAAGYAGGEQTGPTIGETERAWGLMPAASYHSIFEQTVARDYRPRFAALGIEVRWPPQ